MRFSRRDFLAGSAAAAAILPRVSVAQEASPTGPGAAGEQLLRGAYVMTMGPEGDLAEADIRIVDGQIAEIGDRLTAGENAKTLDLSGQFLLPGFVDCHMHLWLTQMRGLFRNTSASAYFPLVERLSRGFRADDIAAGIRLGALEALHAGITFTTPFFDNAREPEFADAAVETLDETGIRARFLYAGHDDLGADEPMLLDHFLSLADTRQATDRVRLGLGWRGLSLENPDANDLLKSELTAARERGLPIGVHARTTTTGPGSIAALIKAGVLGPDMQLIHATGITRDQVAVVNEAGSSITLTPVTEQRVGFGLTTLQDFANVERLSLGIDGNALAGTANMFEQMRLLALTSSGAAGDELIVSPRRLLEMATIEGARSLGLADRIGSIEPGKAADLIAIDPDAINLQPYDGGDPSALLVYSAQPRNVRMVMVAGERLKSDHEMTRADMDAAQQEARRSIEAIRGRVGD
ncbi:amidohydrolase family protein [Jiella marina]|uniref:amidohydrolase family protein n=1 Tax=Jiella sp. LLJ827 TaxID=2917712 RepID=UPI0021012CA8|nr:amidohydrolase family protein [Jiella sp. LLJ827]MCQ0986468.1 amidohydrolase family protein [Jiella sp. LLJ827]